MNTKQYRFDEVTINHDRKRVPLSGKQRAERKGKYRYYGAQGVIDYVDNYLYDGTYLLIAEDGENLKSKKLDIAQIAEGQFWVNNHAHVVQGNELCDTRYLCYLINSMDLSGFITGSAQPKLSQANMNSIVLSIPDMPTQKKIVRIAQAFDKKIQNNLHINDLLEQQARAAFMSKFVDFDGCEEMMVSSPVGTRVPESLKMVQIKDIPHILETGKRPKGGAVKEGVPSVGAESVKRLGYCELSSAKFIPEDFAEKMTKGRINGYELMIYKDGGKPGEFTPHFSMFGEGFPYDYFFINEHVFKLDFGNHGFNEFAYFYFQTDYVTNWLSSNGGKAAIPGINQQDINSIWIFDFEDVRVKEFSLWLQPIFTMILKNCAENQKLLLARNAFLYSLFSGEINIDDINY